MSTIQIDTDTQIYQAIGLLGGLIVVDGDDFSVVIGGDSYKINVKRRAKKCLSNGQVAYLKAYPDFVDGSLTFFVLHAVQPEAVIEQDVNVFSLKGCWEEVDGFPRLAVYRNEMRGKTLDNFRNLVSIIPLDWQNTSPPADGKFWQMKATLKGNGFVVSQILGLGEPPKRGDHSIISVIETPEAIKSTVVEPAKAANTKKKRWNSRKKKEVKVLMATA
jgi:hypothetical protein